MGDVFGMNEAISQANAMSQGVLDHNKNVDVFKKKLQDGLKQKQDQLATTLKEHAGEYGAQTAYYTYDALRRTYEVGSDINKAGLRGYLGQQGAIGKQRLNLLVGRKAESVADLTAKARPVPGSQPRPRRNAMMGEEGTAPEANFHEPPSESVPSAGDVTEEPHRFTGSTPSKGSIPSQVGREARESSGLEGIQATYRSTGTLGGKTLNNTINIGNIGEAHLQAGVPGSFSEALSKARNINDPPERSDQGDPSRRRRGAAPESTEAEGQSTFNAPERPTPAEANLSPPETLQGINQRYDARDAQGRETIPGEGKLFEGQEQPDFSAAFEPEAEVRGEAATYSKASSLPDFVKNTLNRPTRGLDKTTQDMGERLRGEAEGSGVRRGSVGTPATRQQAAQDAQDIADRYSRVGTGEGLDITGKPTRLPSGLPEPMPIKQPEPAPAPVPEAEEPAPEFSVPEVPAPEAEEVVSRGTKRGAGVAGIAEGGRRGSLPLRRPPAPAPPTEAPPPRPSAPVDTRTPIQQLGGDLPTERMPQTPQPAPPPEPTPTTTSTSTSVGTDAPSRPETTTQGTQSLEPAKSSESGGGIKGGVKSAVDEESSKFGQYTAKAGKYAGYLGSAAGIAEGGYDMYQDVAPSGKNDGKTMFEDMDGLQKTSNVLGDIAGVGELAALFVPGVGAIAGLAGAASAAAGGIDTIVKDIDAPKKAKAAEKKEEGTQHDVSAPRLAQQGLVATVQSDNRDTIKPTSTSF
tara:strand:- start:1927 stop:4164 length:2238 start_codon:yes stop_codon:yes gene_type:complete